MESRRSLTTSWFQRHFRRCDTMGVRRVVVVLTCWWGDNEAIVSVTEIRCRRDLWCGQHDGHDWKIKLVVMMTIEVDWGWWRGCLQVWNKLYICIVGELAAWWREKKVLQVRGGEGAFIYLVFVPHVSDINWIKLALARVARQPPVVYFTLHLR